MNANEVASCKLLTKLEGARIANDWQQSSHTSKRVRRPPPREGLICAIILPHEFGTFQYSESAAWCCRVSFCANFSATRVKMQNNASSVEFQAFKTSIAVDSDNSLQRRGSKGQAEHLLQQCVSNLPHAGSVGSIVSRLPFSTVAVCHQDTVGIVRLVGLIDSVIPDATKQRISKAGFCKRILLIKVTREPTFRSGVCQCSIGFLLTYNTGLDILDRDTCICFASGCKLHSIRHLDSQTASPFFSGNFILCFDSSKCYLGFRAGHQHSFVPNSELAQIQRLGEQYEVTEYKTCLTLFSCYVLNWSVLRSWPLQAFALLSLLWCASQYTRFSQICIYVALTLPWFSRLLAQVSRKLHICALRLFFCVRILVLHSR
jgi:hypothetical protein